MKIYVAHSSEFDFNTKLYAPLRESALNSEYEIHLPQENGRETITKELIQGCDVVICDVSMPSTGAGIEMGWANAFGVPVICIYETGSKVSSATSYVTAQVLEYEGREDLIEKLTLALKNL
jgi:nucleoside 2-deoxyribosyltransferase